MEGKVAIITGGGSGIGKHTALRFAREGAKVVVTDINLESANQTAAETKDAGGAALAHDVSKEEAWQQVAAQAIGRFEKVDILFFNAGIYIIKPLAEITLDDCTCDWRRIRDRRRRYCPISGEGKAYEPRT